MKNAIALSLFLCLIIVGCSKDKNNDTPSETPKTNKEMLTAKTWQVEETYQNVSGTRTHYIRGGGKYHRRKHRRYPVKV